MQPELDDRTQLKVSEIFESLQGEGPHAGSPCVFLRLAVCNLRCTWCDTKYTWDFKQHRYEDEVKEQTVVEVAKVLTDLAPRHLVITGGEPLLQMAALEELLGLLDPAVFVEVETNGTLAPSAFLAERVQHWNVSPKLANSGESAARRLRSEPLAAFSALKGAWLKLVLLGAADWDEAAALLAATAWPRERALIMPVATTSAELSQRAPSVAALAVQHQLRFSTRLQLLLWDGARGT